MRQTLLGSRLKGFIYDTLTVRNDVLPPCDYTLETGDISSGNPDLEGLPPKAFKVLSHYGWRYPVLEKRAVSSWIHRGRDYYNWYYRRQIKAGKMEKLSVKYFCALEYGPLWGRPHVHLIMTGISRADYVRFFAKPWRRDMGFTKTKWVQKSAEDAGRVAAYISKYLVKGSFELDIVKMGLVPRAWRVISQGIGAEYLETFEAYEKFRWLYDLKTQMALHHDYERWSIDSEAMSSHVLSCLDAQRMDNLKSRVENGYKFALPRFYRYILLNLYHNSLGGYTIQDALQRDARRRCFEEIARFASDKRLIPGASGQDACSVVLERDLGAYNRVIVAYTLYKADANLRKARIRNRVCKNFINRSLQADYNSQYLTL